MATNRSLHALYLKHNNAGPRGLQAVGKALVRNRALQHLDVSYNRGVVFDVKKFSSDFRGLDEFTNALPWNEALVCLNLEANGLCGGKRGAVGITPNLAYRGGACVLLLTVL